MTLKYKNKGISYIEFILVLAIMILLTTLATVTMSIVNRNNVTKGADRLSTGINHAKTLSLSKGAKKGCITFAAKGSNIYYYYGENIGDKYNVCNAPCNMHIAILNGTGPSAFDDDISGNTQLRLKFSPSTGAFVGAECSYDNGATFSPCINETGQFGNLNRITIDNNHGKRAIIDLNIHVGTVKVSYVNY
jgi:Tfp pilus assembly protein FimT